LMIKGNFYRRRGKPQALSKNLLFIFVLIIKKGRKQQERNFLLFSPSSIPKFCFGFSVPF